MNACPAWLLLLLAVVGTNRHACSLYGGHPIKDQSGYLMPGRSRSSSGPAAGTSSCPWLIRARPGQRVNLTLFNLDRQHSSAVSVSNHSLQLPDYAAKAGFPANATNVRNVRNVRIASSNQ